MNTFHEVPPSLSNTIRFAIAYEEVHHGKPNSSRLFGAFLSIVIVCVAIHMLFLSAYAMRRFAHNKKPSSCFGGRGLYFYISLSWCHHHLPHEGASFSSTRSKRVNCRAATGASRKQLLHLNLDGSLVGSGVSFGISGGNALSFYVAL